MKKKKLSMGVVLLLEAVVFVLTFSYANISMNGLEGGSQCFSRFIDIPSILLIVLLVIPAIIISGQGKDFVRAFSVGKKEYTLRELKRSLEAVQTMQKMILCAAGMMSLVAIVTVLWLAISTEVFGPALAVSILIILYGGILEFFLLPVKANVQNTITDIMGAEDEEA